MSVKRLALLPLLGWVVPALPGDFSSGSLEVRAASGLPGSHECDVGVLAGGVSPPARWPRLSLHQRSARFFSSGSLEGRAVSVLCCSRERALSGGLPLPARWPRSAMRSSCDDCDCR